MLAILDRSVSDFSREDFTSELLFSFSNISWRIGFLEIHTQSCNAEDEFKFCLLG
jgi:hypothetical protein